ncbi:hypothetical protein CSC62_16565 [Pseudoxanthomonas jiangsuensis]|uniref:hypothetical protein n=1 Tax=Pseudoxanthomonas jiangsuensis TaxID=619688 RepID=UPI0013915123|nr:hypothetical protein [Pseudoxanthomonas jiangsuensis]KAF1691053.1 hypothetical protein CSC62_16565 [Pseudoxanthomonas jiangsuensis]
MPLPESTQAATLTFDAAVHRALARRLADTPYPHNGRLAPQADAASARPAGALASPAADAGDPAAPGIDSSPPSG